MNRINALRNIVGARDSVAWGKEKRGKEKWGKNCWGNEKEKWAKETKNLNNIATGLSGNIHALAFSALLIACSIAVGCSSDKPKPVTANNQTPVAQTPSPIAPAPAMLAESKPAPKKIVRRKPATVNYTDKTYGVTFEYPRRYAIETGDAAAELLLSNPVPMNFVQPGGIALAAVELPETSYVNTDFSSAFFDASVHKSLTADQCTEFAVPQPKVAAVTTTENVAPETKPATQPATPSSEAESVQAVQNQPASAPPIPAQPASPSPEAQTVAAQSAPAAETADETTSSTSAQNAPPAPDSQSSKLLLGDMELRATEAVSGEGARQSDSKYFHVFQNGACYEFGLNVTTVASQDGLIKHVDRDKVFNQLEKILATVKINTVVPEVNAETPASTPAPPVPAQ
jgi:hypothetical protein